MKSNFHLKSRQENQALHINLHGVFDGASAFELIRAITEGEHRVERIYVHTNRLTRAFSFGKSILNSHLPKTSSLRPKLNFSGAWATEILPEGCSLLEAGDATGRRCKGDCKNCACRKIGNRRDARLLK